VGVQRGTAVVRRRSDRTGWRRNLTVFDFDLTAAEMAAISGAGPRRRFNDPGVFCDAAFNTFCRSYE